MARRGTDLTDGGDGALRIALIAPPFIKLPPAGYAGTERVVAALAVELHRRGHHVSVFAPADSDLPCEVVPTVPAALWQAGFDGDEYAALQATVAQAWEQADRFDIIHSHVEVAGLLMARYCATPMLSTFHGRLDHAGVADLLHLMPDVPLVAISESQKRWSPDADWVATIHHGLDFSGVPRSSESEDYLLVIGRLSPEKGIVEAIEVARRTRRRLIMAAKVRLPDERVMFDEVVTPAIEEGIVDWRGEIGGSERDELMAGALATLMLGSWPEPFGLVAIESMATGTPVIARRAGALPETIEHGVTGFLVDDVKEAILAVSRVDSLPRPRISAYARGRFSSDRMASLYEQAYETVLARSRTVGAPATDRVPGAPSHGPAALAGGTHVVAHGSATTNGSERVWGPVDRERS